MTKNTETTKVYWYKSARKFSTQVSGYFESDENDVKAVERIIRNQKFIPPSVELEVKLCN